MYFLGIRASAKPDPKPDAPMTLELNYVLKVRKKTLLL